MKCSDFNCHSCEYVVDCPMDAYEKGVYAAVSHMGQRLPADVYMRTFGTLSIIEVVEKIAGRKYEQ